ncbi:hypothetical protein WR25_14004 isoform A [Diploscapter pachys]|uniref:Uncharacterized protein n=1 Tax=Diploscapter pachys TaxID=2018661 RepID=A0A2A2KVN2_9BILA|nr:hypothetical protein WR25_14004 isoform A [Diploscapter pachys]
MVCIGIDLGTTYSCVAIVKDGRPVAIKNDNGRNTLPSVVAFRDGEILVGNPALDCNTDMENILYDSKRLIGWHALHDLPINENGQLWTFNTDTRDNCAGYILNRGTPNERFIRPEKVSAEILKSLKARTEKDLSKQVTEAIVTVPAMFNSDQIAATKKAIELAGLKLKCLLQEPTAAAIAYNEKAKLGNSELLVFDFGGEEAIAHGAAIVANDNNKTVILVNHSVDELRNKFKEKLAINPQKRLFYLYSYGRGKICLFDSQSNSVEPIGKFNQSCNSYEVATTPDKIIVIDSTIDLFEIFDLKTQKISKGPNPPEWRGYASVAYFKDKLYYLGGKDPKLKKDTNRVNILVNEEWKDGSSFPMPISCAQPITCNEELYVIGRGTISQKIYRLSDDEREWVEIGEIEEGVYGCAVASLNGRVYITGGESYGVSKSCLRFDPSAPVDSRISRIADMNCGRHHHSLIVANGKLYAIGG